MSAWVVLITTPDEASAVALARALVDAHLAACCNLIPGIRSIYHWQGERCEESEWLLIAKTTAEVWPQLVAEVHKHHPYTTPELIALPAAAVAEPYLNWLVETVVVSGARS